mmetsp:Transcript_22272/g.57212  ORF Transcript_22272/g.57212 Transcript_22272/m.57212 type:complete len:212 (-) Transcript_22272:457-1092(-)
MLGQPVGGHDGVLAEAQGAEHAVERPHGLRVDRLGAVDHVAHGLERDRGPLLGRERLPLARRQRVRERGRLRVRAPVLRQRGHPQGGLLDEAEGRHVPPLAAAREQAQVRADQPHVVVLRQPRDLDRGSVDGERADNHAQVVRQVRVRDAHALGLRRRARRVLQERDRARLGRRRERRRRGGGLRGDRVSEVPAELGPLVPVRLEELLQRA